MFQNNYRSLINYSLFIIVTLYKLSQKYRNVKEYYIKRSEKKRRRDRMAPKYMTGYYIKGEAMK